MPKNKSFDYFDYNDKACSNTNNNKDLFSVNLKFITPTRIMFNEKLVSEPEFHIYVRNTLRRISNLHFFHCVNTNNNDNKFNDSNDKNGEMSISKTEKSAALNSASELDFNYYIEKSLEVNSKKSLKWYSLDRYSNRQKTHMKLSGFIGDISYENVPYEYLWIIKLGELIHIGKNTTFGHGKYSIVSII